ncbi:MAG: alanine--tRNA ligase [Anaerolineae bacterium]|nr:alanine--tRNA ligase [Anaerolineae bacterium]
MDRPMTSSEIRQAFLDYFAERGHAVVPSASLVPHDDPTLLFTNAGMVQFKDMFLGTGTRPYTRAVDTQKCLRVAGKHNDLEDVGRDGTHHTLFEMLGNWSFGDYYKKEAIRWAWDILTRVYKLDPERIWATIFEDDEGDLPRDDEAAEYWQTETDINPDHILPFGRKDNFWMMADTGPCGPNSEISYDRGPEACDKPGIPGHVCQVNGDCARYTEIWNLVFMQFNSLGDGILEPLPAKHVDTGLGYDRLVAILQGKNSNYRTDLFWPIILKVQEMTGHSNSEREHNIIAYRVIADHIRAVVCLIGDGVLPANDGRGYVLRMILRRAIRFGRTLGLTGPFMTGLADLVIASLGHVFPELPTRVDFIKATIASEENRFLRTLDQGLDRLATVMDELQQQGIEIIPGDQIFYLHDTLGLPFEVTRDIAEENGFQVDEVGYRAAREAQRARGRASGAFEMGPDQHAMLYPELQTWIANREPDTILQYDPYSELETQTRVSGMIIDEAITETAHPGDKIELVLQKTPFYVASGGQVSDIGSITGRDWQVDVQDVVRPVEGMVIHLGTVQYGHPRVADSATAAVEVQRRRATMRNHTATHLLHRALREIVGSHVQQGGSVVAPDRLRFDYNHDAPLTSEQRDAIERMITDAVTANYPVTARQENYRDALSQGVIALFEEKYGDVVRVLRVGSAEAPYSQELCGGTHVQRTGDIGAFVILSESGIGAGIRRIEAATGRGALKAMQALRGELEQAAHVLDCPPSETANRVQRLLDAQHDAAREIEQLNRDLAKVNFKSLLNDVVDVQGVPVLAAVVEAADTATLREMADWFRDRMQGGVIVLGSIINEKPLLIAATTKAMVKERGIHAGNVVRELAKIVGGGGGGRPDIAQAGGRDAGKLPDAIKAVPELLTAMLK